MKKILPLFALASVLLVPLSFAAENTANKISSLSVVNTQIEGVGAQEIDLKTEDKNTLAGIDNKDISDNEDMNDEEKDNYRESDKYEKNNHEDDNYNTYEAGDEEENMRENHHERHDNEEEDGDEEEIILFLVGALSGFLGLAFGAGGTLFYLHKKNNKE